MNRIDRIFQTLSSQRGKALMPFITAGDGGVELLGSIIPALEQGGASICEVGIPFSDPIADGPVIQASMTRALDAGIRVEQVFEQIASVRDKTELGLVAMVSYSIVYRIGLDAFVKQSAQAGFDGFIFPDLPLEESQAARDAAADAGLILSMLIAPTTPIDRAQQIAAASTGFAYVVSRRGITGESGALPPELPDRLAKLRDVTDAPMAVGFGISSPDQVRDVVAVADAAIVGSALVRRMHEHPGDAAGQALAMTRELTAGLPNAQADA
ncbi:MAG: tryptophan synthase subunit alpha [Phycisphaeraceae bacterium]